MSGYRQKLFNYAHSGLIACFVYCTGCRLRGGFSLCPSQNIGWVELSRTLLFNGTNRGIECRFQLVDRHVSIKYT